MGFIQRRLDVVGGTAEFPTGTSYADRLFRSKTILTKAAEALIACNVGWQLDTNKSASTTDYANIPDYSGTEPFPGLFLVNSISGCKLFMAYFGDNAVTNGIKDFSGNDIIPFNGYKYHCGLCMSMIPAGSSSVFGDPSTTTFIPSDATRVVGSYYSNQSSLSNPQFCAAYNPTNNAKYTYIILATAYCISVFTTHDDGGVAYNLAMPTYACGRIFGFISHEETQNNARYGTVIFRYSMGSFPEAWVAVCSTNDSPVIYGSGINFPWYSATYTHNPVNGNYQTCGAISKADGTWVNGSGTISGYRYNVTLFTVNPWLLERTYTFENSNTNIRWSPIGMMSVGNQNNISDIEISPGNCFKGLLDTELFRACNASVPRGSIFDNGKFIVPEDNVGWLIGWDPSNDPI